MRARPITIVEIRIVNSLSADFATLGTTVSDDELPRHFERGKGSGRIFETPQKQLPGPLAYLFVRLIDSRQPKTAG
jgi:hypothetical protein